MTTETPAAESGDPRTPPPKGKQRQVHWKTDSIMDKENVNFLAIQPPGSQNKPNLDSVSSRNRRNAPTPQSAPPKPLSPLRKHLAELPLTTPRRPQLASGPVRLKKRSTPYLSSGAVRLSPPSPPNTASKSRSTLNKRIGYDGTCRTPSRELLKPTRSSIGHQFKQQSLNDESLDITGVIHGAQGNGPVELQQSSGAPAVSSNSTVSVSLNMSWESHYSGRSGECDDPVAHILMNDGIEDYQMLVQYDRSMMTYEDESVTVNSSESGSSGLPVTKLTRGVCSGTRAGIVRPVPSRALPTLHVRNEN